MTAQLKIFKRKTHLVQLVEELGGAPYNEDSDAYYLRQTFEQEIVGTLKELENSNLNVTVNRDPVTSLSSLSI